MSPAAGTLQSMSGLDLKQCSCSGKAELNIQEWEGKSNHQEIDQLDLGEP